MRSTIFTGTSANWVPYSTAPYRCDSQESYGHGEQQCGIHALNIPYSIENADSKKSLKKENAKLYTLSNELRARAAQSVIYRVTGLP